MQRVVVDPEVPEDVAHLAQHGPRDAEDAEDDDDEAEALYLHVHQYEGGYLLAEDFDRDAGRHLDGPASG